MVLCTGMVDNSRNLIFNNYFLKVIFTETIAGTEFILITIQTLSEGTVSQIFYLSLTFYFVKKNGKHFVKFGNIVF